MAKFDRASKILIIGSGVSGLALAQILRKEKIQVEVFERDDGTRSQGWALGLDEYVKIH